MAFIKKGKLILLLLILLPYLTGCVNQPLDTSSASQTNLVQAQEAVSNTQIDKVEPSKTVEKKVEAKSNSNLSNDKYYTNSAGNKVHSPAYAPSIPAGASAKCKDGTYSFSQSRRGTCSHHGGVATWY